MARSILDQLSKGPATAGHLSETTGVPEPLVVRRLQSLVLDHRLATVHDTRGPSPVYARPRSKENLTMGSLLVLATTETDSIEAATRNYALPGKSRPHSVIDPKLGMAITMTGFDVEAETTREVSTAMATAMAARSEPIYWLDIVGWANRLPEEAEWWEALGTTVRAVCSEHGIRVTFPRSFVSFVASNGPHDQRLTQDEFELAEGIIGVQHLPGGHMGEPGDMNRLREVLTAGADTKAPTALAGIQGRLHAAGFYHGPVGGSDPAEASMELEAAVAQALDRVNALEDMADAQRSEIHGLVDRTMVDDSRLEAARTGLSLFLDAVLGPEAGPRAMADLEDLEQSDGYRGSTVGDLGDGSGTWEVIETGPAEAVEDQVHADLAAYTDRLNDPDVALYEDGPIEPAPSLIEPPSASIVHAVYDDPEGPPPE